MSTGRTVMEQIPGRSVVVFNVQGALKVELGTPGELRVTSSDRDITISVTDAGVAVSHTRSPGGRRTVTASGPGSIAVGGSLSGSVSTGHVVIGPHGVSVDGQTAADSFLGTVAYLPPGVQAVVVAADETELTPAAQEAGISLVHA
jgi:hypothetical protein